MRLVLILFLSLNWSLSYGESYSLGAFGDSITAAALAKFNLKTKNKSSATIFTDDENLADAQLQAMKLHTYFSIIDFPEFSWSTGDKIHSFANFLNSIYEDINKSNFAISGSRTDDLIAQVSDAIGNKSTTQLSTILIGANNLCSDDALLNNPLFAKAQLKQAMESLLMMSDTKVLLLDIPRIQDLSLFKDDIGFLGSRCETIWKSSLFYCKRMTADHDRLWVENEVATFNQAWKEAAEELQADYPERIRFYPVFKSNPIEAQYLSADCFHPNKKGQEHIAKVLSDSLQADLDAGDNFLGN